MAARVRDQKKEIVRLLLLSAGQVDELRNSTSIACGIFLVILFLCNALILVVCRSLRVYRCPPLAIVSVSGKLGYNVGSLLIFKSQLRCYNILFPAYGSPVASNTRLHSIRFLYHLFSFLLWVFVYQRGWIRIWIWEWSEYGIWLNISNRSSNIKNSLELQPGEILPQKKRKQIKKGSKRLNKRIVYTAQPYGAVVHLGRRSRKEKK